MGALPFVNKYAVHIQMSSFRTIIPISSRTSPGGWALCGSGAPMRMPSVKRKETTVQGARGQVRRSRSSHALRDACGSCEIRLMALLSSARFCAARYVRWQTWEFSCTRDHDSDSDGRRGPYGDRADARDIETDREKTHGTDNKGSTLMFFLLLEP